MQFMIAACLCDAAEIRPNTSFRTLSSSIKLEIYTFMIAACVYDVSSRRVAPRESKQ